MTDQEYQSRVTDAVCDGPKSLQLPRHNAGRDACDFTETSGSEEVNVQ